MIHQQIKDLFFSSVEHVVSDISQYAVHPDFDFQRSRKIPAQKLISFLISQGSSSTRVEMLDFWGLILSCQLLLRSTTSGQNSNPRHWKLYSGTLIPLLRNCQPLP